MFEFFNLLIIIQTLIVLIVGTLFQEEIELLWSKDDAVDTQVAVVEGTFFVGDAAVDAQIGVIITRANVGHGEGVVAQINGVDLGGVALEGLQHGPVAYFVLVLTIVAHGSHRYLEAVGLQLDIASHNVCRHQNDVDAIGGGTHIRKIINHSGVGALADGRHLKTKTPTITAPRQCMSSVRRAARFARRWCTVTEAF